VIERDRGDTNNQIHRSSWECLIRTVRPHSSHCTNVFESQFNVVDRGGVDGAVGTTGVTNVGSQFGKDALEDGCAGLYREQ
jgi:hypothetical protein